MESVKLPRFSGIIRAIGGICLIPSVVGMGFALIGLVSTFSTPTDSTGAVVGAGLAGGFFLVIGLFAFVGGLLGWLLLLERNVFRCSVCGHFIDRA